ncbi:ATP-binding domain-containing protein [Streptomyces sp. NPDC006627]|uniref:ATP-binding domain-containing protein n=1 Tax=Streptomyces sp. NPDC006627 TaxID=3154679 RepID=UPI0033B166C0
MSTEPAAAEDPGAAAAERAESPAGQGETPPAPAGPGAEENGGGSAEAAGPGAPPSAAAGPGGEEHAGGTAADDTAESREAAALSEAPSAPAGPGAQEDVGGTVAEGSAESTEAAGPAAPPSAAAGPGAQEDVGGTVTEGAAENAAAAALSETPSVSAGPGVEDADGTPAEGTAESAEATDPTEGPAAAAEPGAQENADGTAAEGAAESAEAAGLPEGPSAPAGPGEEEGVGGAAAEGVAESAEAVALSEAEAEIAAQRELRERIEQRKASKEGPIEAGTKLSGTAADLLAAVRAVESGEKPVAGAFREPEPARRRPTPPPAREPVRPRPATEAAPAEESVAAVRAVLAEGGAPETLAAPTAATLGEGADDRLRADPWQLLRVGGVRPEQADGFARALLGPDCGPGDERRGRAITVWLLEQAAVAGHTALDAAALTAALGQRAVPDPDAAVHGALAEGDALVFQDALEGAETVPVQRSDDEGGQGPEGGQEELERPVRVLIGLERYAMAEESLADGLARIINSLPKEGGPGPRDTDWEAAAAEASGSTAELIRAVGGHGLVLHSGGEAARAEPAALVTAAAALGLRVCAAAHSSDGRRRLAQATGTHEAAVTVAGLLSGAQGPGRDADGALALDLLVVLDAPQLDVESAAMLVESLPDGARLVLSGDPGVLWSAGPGRVFADLVAARCCPHVVSRTPDPGPLGELTSGIGIGELNAVEAPGKEVVLVPVRDAAEAIHRTVQLVADSVPRAIGVPAEQTQVITPGHGGAAGTRALNAALKERLNPGPGRFGGFDPGDRVAHVPAAGRTTLGHVVRADAEGLHLECDGDPVLVRRERVEREVRHAWALTAHQAAGLRWPAVVVVLPGDAAQTLTRPWVYTAFTRGERHLSVVQGVEQALPRAVAERLWKDRTTRLRTLLRPQVPSAAP